MPSAIIRRIYYVPDSQELTVELVTGRRYLYCDVPAEEAAAFRSAFAKGIYFNRHIRSRYPYRELTEAD